MDEQKVLYILRLVLVVCCDSKAKMYNVMFIIFMGISNFVTYYIDSLQA